MLPIDKNVPIPEIYPTKPYRYPFAKMEVGDSFFVENVSKSFSIYSMVKLFNERRKTTEQIKVKQRREGNGVRVWRVE